MIPAGLMKTLLTRVRIITDADGLEQDRLYDSFPAYWEPKRKIIRGGVGGEIVFSSALIIAPPGTDVQNGDWVHEGEFTQSNPPSARGFEVGVVFQPNVPSTGITHQVEALLI